MIGSKVLSWSKLKDIILLSVDKKFCKIRLENKALLKNKVVEVPKVYSENPRALLQTAGRLKPGW